MDWILEEFNCKIKPEDKNPWILLEYSTLDTLKTFPLNQSVEFFPSAVAL